MLQTRFTILAILCLLAIASGLEAKNKVKLHSTLKPGTKIGDVCVNPKDGAKMVWVPAGWFLMGSEVFEDAKPRRTVYLDSYWVYKYEVTVGQYRKFCSESGKQMPKMPSWGWIDSHPIVNVSWQDATTYAKWAGGSLPTEAQWEKAARGTDGREYPWGNQWDASKCNGYSKGPKKTQTVGSYASGVSPYGCMDMAGNVWEWCADWFAYEYYKSAPSRNPTGASNGKYRVLRGGGWNYGVNGNRCACRGSYDPTISANNFGFRLAR